MLPSPESPIDAAVGSFTRRPRGMSIRPCWCQTPPARTKIQPLSAPSRLPTSTVLPSPAIATFAPKRAPKEPCGSSSAGVSFGPCCTHFEPDRTNTQAAPAPPSSLSPPITAVVPSREIAMLDPKALVCPGVARSLANGRGAGPLAPAGCAPRPSPPYSSSAASTASTPQVRPHPLPAETDRMPPSTRRRRERSAWSEQSAALRRARRLHDDQGIAALPCRAPAAEGARVEAHRGTPRRSVGARAESGSRVRVAALAVAASPRPVAATVHP